ncbi:hypothetical protein LAC81_19395 [Ensifer adhaerens]|uniref:hypothetical protein n=1 Tax=Ensifer adhaerens TaxID=106592 RepID=UPI001CBEC7CA|nr:hypothetical protein [Ensifer adhaerens]MBZ7923955.1 hypothetical protein [Ensifer adhaerens]UAX92490.1 hypothetical protein LAC78_19390 [Ensifer adhaerens]UAY00125.1 hypothetical protein LAC80_19395 [Ensifer adhaerens]UAY07508.1 hypothetical protein LAC81_19395 [Ensifer adhaerens]
MDQFELRVSATLFDGGLPYLVLGITPGRYGYQQEETAEKASDPKQRPKAQNRRADRQTEKRRQADPVGQKRGRLVENGEILPIPSGIDLVADFRKGRLPPKRHNSGQGRRCAELPGFQPH